MKGLKAIIFAAAALITAPAVITSCDDWTEAEPNDYYTPPSDSYNNNLKEYFASPHKVMFGWFGNWGGNLQQNSLTGLPDSTDFVSLWLTWGPLTPDQQADLKAFQNRGSRAVLCWLATNIGENITPGYSGVPPIEAAKEFWGFVQTTDINPETGTYYTQEEALATQIEAAKKYADAIADTCDKYGVNGFDMDIEAHGTLIQSTANGGNQVQNEFLRHLRKRFNKPTDLLVIDIPGGSSWLGYYNELEQDVVEMVDYICWQTYELGHSGLNNFFNAVKGYKPDIYESVLAKSIVTATFERAVDKHYFLEQSTWKSNTGLPHAGQGAYHIEYDYAGYPDYPEVRKAIGIQNPPVNE